MGVRIQAYAVDVPRFEEFVAQPVGAALRYVAARSTDPQRRLLWSHPDGGHVWFTPGEGVIRTQQGRTEIFPDGEPVLWLSVWTGPDAYFVVDWLRRILELEPRFQAPPKPAGLCPDTDDEWNEWVHEMLRQFLVIEETRDFRRLAVVTFID